MQIVTSSNAGYILKMRPYLESLSKNSQVPATVVCVGDFIFDPHLPGIDSVTLPRSLNHGAPVETECAQHGSWLQVVPGEPDDLVIYTDGDIILQRPFTHAELDWLADLPDNVIALGYNSGPQETLAVEAQRLQPRVTMDQLAVRLGEIAITAPCYNIGVMAARRSTYQRIYDAYMPLWRLACDAFGHAARQQWLFCYLLAKLGVKVEVTPYSFHANGHYGTPPGCLYADGLLYSGNDVVLFRHRL
jgi:hypothetical protein